MTLFIRKYKPQIIVILVGLILTLLLILFTNMNVEKINRQMQENVQAAENIKIKVNASHQLASTDEQQ
jgi:uncharacterized integral membrane protein